MYTREELIAEINRKAEERKREMEAHRRRMQMKANAYDNMINHSRTKAQHDMYEMLWRSL